MEPRHLIEAPVTHVTPNAIVVEVALHDRDYESNPTTDR